MRISAQMGIFFNSSRKHYARETNDDVNSPNISVLSCGLKMTDVERNLIWLLRTLWEDDDLLFLIRPSLVMDELDPLLQSEPQAKEFVSSYVAQILGDLSITTQCTRQLELYQPWAQNFENSFLDFQDKIENDFRQHAKPEIGIMAALKDKDMEKVAKLAEPTPGKFTYPFDKRRTKANVQALRAAESNLDRVWAQVDRIINKASIDLTGTAIHRLLSEPRSVQRTPEWVEPAETKKKAEPEQDGSSQMIEAPSSPLFFDLAGSGVEGRSMAGSTKSKTKKKGKPQEKEEHPPPEALGIAGVELNHAQPTFSVDPRALKVFRTPFFNPVATSTPGEVPWNDFLHAMMSTGFKANKLYGSVWHFSPTELDVERSIHFHEPHPKGKLPFEVARRYGRRLTRAYGWFGDIFVLKAK